MQVDEIRQLIIDHNKLQNVDEKYTFYYDETNNIRKLYLTENGLNVQQDKSFVLAGIVHIGEYDNSRFDSLFTSLALQKTSNELKLKHIAKGGPFDMLKSAKLRQVFNWLNDNHFYIHYLNLNPMYWSIVDIIDSIVGESNKYEFIFFHLQLKADLYELASSNRDEFLKQLALFNYPDVAGDKVRGFCLWLVSFVKSNNEQLPTHRASLLTHLLITSLELEELPFISGFHGKQLIDSFMVFYLQKLYIFKNSRHIFDEEEQLQAQFEGFLLEENGKPLTNHEFAKSHDCRGVQVSDVIAGFLGKYFTYIKDTSEEQLAADIAKLTEMQRKCFQSLMCLIDKSDTQSQGFFTYVNSDFERRRHQYFCNALVSNI